VKVHLPLVDGKGGGGNWAASASTKDPVAVEDPGAEGAAALSTTLSSMPTVGVGRARE